MKNSKDLQDRVRSIGGTLIYCNHRNGYTNNIIFYNRISYSPWYVAHDPWMKAIIVCIRGSKSFADIATDYLSGNMYYSYFNRYERFSLL